jgi:hypothetical protein
MNRNAQATMAVITAGRTSERGSTLRPARAAAIADPSEPPAVPAEASAVPVSVFTPDSIAYTPCRPTEITRRRLRTSSAIAATANGVMSR